MPTQTDACLIYARMSLDSPLGVERQLEDCRALAAREGWPVAGEYVDDGRSATNGKPRPDYLRLLADAQAGRGSRVIAWDQDRLLRDPDERGPWVKLADQGRVAVFNAAGIELTADPFTFGIKALVAENEVRTMKKRLRRSLVQRAAMGRPHGRPAYGWSATLVGPEPAPGQGKARRRMRSGPDVIDPEAAAVIRESAAALLAGDSVYAVAQRLNAAGVTTSGGGKWTQQQLRTILLRPRNAGLVVHRGQVVGEGSWPPILDRDTFDRITALLTDPSRLTNGGGSRPKHLLSTLPSVTCGKCSGLMVVNTGGRDPGRRNAYRCRDCHGVTRTQEPVDRLVEGAVILRLERPDALAALTPDADPVQRDALLSEADGLRARLDLAADQFADGAITAEQLVRITARLQPKIQALQDQVAALAPRADLTPLAGPDAAAKWAAASLDVKRAAIDTLLTVVILPEPPKGRAPFNPDSVKITWR